MSRKQRVSYRVENIEPIAAGEITNEKQITVYNPDRKEDFQATVGDLKGVFGGEDNTTDTRIPYKTGVTFEDSPLRYNGTKLISDVTLEVPPGTVQIGEGLDLSAGGVVPIFRSRLTGIQYVPTFNTYDTTGSTKPFVFNFAAETNVVLQSDFSTSIPLTGTFNNTVTQTEFLNTLIIKTDANATLTNVRMQFIAQSTGLPIYYFPSKNGWEQNVGQDLVADLSGDIRIDLTDAPIGLLAAEVVINNYKIDSGVLYGNSSNVPYQAFDLQVASQDFLATEQWVIDHGAVADSFVGLTDTPNDYNVSEIQNVVVNPFIQKIIYKKAELSDNSDIQISAPATGEILEYNEGTAKWINNEPRLATAIASFNDIDNVNTWGDATQSILFVNDNNSVPTDTPATSRINDSILIINMNTEFGRNVVLSARAGETINGTSSYTLGAGKVALFVKDTDTAWKFAGENPIVTTLTNQSVTSLSDVTDAGSGAIITNTERTKLNNLEEAKTPIVITSNLVITSGNYEPYNNALVIGEGITNIVVDLPLISTISNGRIIFTFTNNSSNDSSMDIRANGSDTINGSFFGRLNKGETISLEKPSSGTEWLVLSEVQDMTPLSITDNKEVSIPVDNKNIFVKYTDFAAGTDITQNLPALNAIGDNIKVTFRNDDTDTSHIVTLTPNGTETINGETEFSIRGGGEMVGLTSDSTNGNWLINSYHADESTTETGIDITDGTTTVDNAKKITVTNGKITGDDTNVDLTPYIDIGEIGGQYTLVKAKELEVLAPLQVNESDPNVAQLVIYPGAYEKQHAPGFYASLNDDVEVVGYKNGVVRQAPIWFDNIIKPAGAFIQIDRNNKAIGLQEDDTLDPNVTGGTAYLIFLRTAFKGNATADGYIQVSLRDKLTGDILEDDLGNLMAVRKDYKELEEFKALEITGIKKFTGIEEFQMIVEENFDGEELVLLDRTEANSCIMIQSLNTDDQTSRALLQMENDTGINLEWTSHYLGASLYNVAYFLQEDKPLTTITAGTGETGADGWHLSNFTEMKVGIASNTLTLEDDGSNLVGFSFGNIISSEKTILLRNKVINAFITTTTPEGAGRVYGASWTGTPEAYTKDIITDINPAGEPVMATNWELLGTSIFCTEDATGNPNTYSGAFTVPADANNFALIFVPGGKQQPNKFEITSFYADVATPFNGYFIHAPEIDGEKHLVEDTRYFECGLNTEGYASLRYTINQADTPMPAGKLIKGKADITPNWANIGGAVDFLTFNNSGNANIATTFNVYPGESIPAGQTSLNTFWWAYKQGVDWIKIDDSEITHTAIKDVTVPQLVTIPSFTYKAKDGDELRCFAKSDINDGAYIQSTSPHVYLCETTIDFTEFVPGSEDEPITSLYVQDSLQNDWELTAETDGRLKTLLVGDLPENEKRHVIQDDLNLNDFTLTGDGISLVEKMTSTEYTEINANTDLDDYRNYIVDTTSNTVTINIPYEETRAFTVRDATKEFDTNNCIITIRDSLDAIVHTATLDKRDKGYIFYNSDGTENGWKYGEIGKGLITAIASDHVASTDFGNVSTDTLTNDCRMFNVKACYSNASNMGTSDGDFASKKYVDDTAASFLNTLTIAPTANIENYDVSSLSPVGTLFVNNDANREIRSLAGGVHGDIVHVVHLTTHDLKFKRSDSYTGQQIQMPNNADDIFNIYGGCTLIYNGDTGYWHATGVYY